MTKVMVFGVFDGVHEGHRDFLRQARECGDFVVGVVTRDMVVQSLKGKLPSRSEKERVGELRDTGLVDKVVLGDEKMGTWGVVERHKPNVIVLGYDQESLRDALEMHLKKFGLGIEVRIMEPHEPEKFHSSLLDS
jgi:cytidyltransferase-like protein